MDRPRQTDRARCAGRHRHGRQSRGTRGAAPLDGARAGPSRDGPLPRARYAIGPAIDDGFYYDFELPDDALHRRRSRAHRSEDARDHQAGSAVRPRGVARRRLGSASPISRTSRRSSRRSTPRRSARARSSRCTATRDPTAASSSISVGVRTCRRRSASARSSCRRSPVRTGGATSTARCCSGSTARRGRARTHSPSISIASRRPSGATIASSARARPVLVPRGDRFRARGVPSEGRARPQAHGGLLPRAP